MIKTKTNEEFQKQFYDKFGKGEYELISDYIGCDKPVKIRHKCGYEFEKKPKNILPNKMSLHCPYAMLISIIIWFKMELMI